MTLQRTTSENPPPNKLMVGGFLLPKFWKASVILKTKADEMVIASMGKELNSYFSDIIK